MARRRGLKGYDARSWLDYRAVSVIDDVNAALAQGDMIRAGDLAAAALTAGQRHPRLYGVAAFRLSEAGRFEDALRLLGPARAMAPDDANLAHGTGFCLARLGRGIEAIGAFDAALRLAPGFPPSLHHKGVVLEGMGDDEPAARLYELATLGDPTYADAWSGRASIAVRRGDYPAAREFADRALGLAPGLTNARMALAQADYGEGLDDSAARRLESLLADPTFNPADQPAALALFGDVRDRQGDAGSAFALYAQGKALSHEQYAATPIAEAAGVHVARLEALHRFVRSLDPIARATAPVRAATADGPRAHVFLMGFPRSGTTLLEQILASAEDVVTLDEKPLLERAESEFLTSVDRLRILIEASDEALEPHRTFYWRLIEARGLDVSGKVFVDKFPLNSLLTPLIVRLFPDAKIVFAERDPRDVVFSCFRRCFQMNPAMYQFTTLEGAARFYDLVMRLALEYRRVFAPDMHVVRYETLVDSLENECRRLCGALGLDWTGAMLNFADTAKQRSITTPSASQVRKGLYGGGVGQWRRYAEPLRPALTALGPWIERLGYA